MNIEPNIADKATLDKVLAILEAENGSAAAAGPALLRMSVSKPSKEEKIVKPWKEERCSTRPEELQIIAPGLYMERKDIKEVEHAAVIGKDGEEISPAYTDYVCQSRVISVSEYEMLKAISEIDTNKAIDDYTMQLIEEGVL